MNCLVCKSGTMQSATDSYFVKMKDHYVIIENVPCKKCDQCGEVVYSALVVEKIEELIDKLGRNIGRISILDYAEAA